MDCIAEVQAILGEGPCWVERDQSVYWTDINQPCLFRWNEMSGLVWLPMSEKICSIVPRASGGYLGAGYNGLLAIDAHFNVTPICTPEAHLPGNRFNDGKVDRNGRFWAGTMDHKEVVDSGTLYRVDFDLSWAAIDTGYRVTNGPAFSLDGCTMYHTDSAVQRVYRFALDADGSASAREVFLQFKPEDGYPDGMTVDAENCLWIAFWDGWCVRRFSPEGDLLVEIPVPVARPTSVAFGGAEFERIFISSASRNLTGAELADQPNAGGLFSFCSDACGIAELPFAG